MSTIVFLDTETLGLGTDAPVWEFAAIRRGPDGINESVQFTIQHSPTVAAKLLPGMPEKFQIDYRARFDPAEAISEDSAAKIIDIYTADAIVVCCNPLFDLPRLTALMQRHHVEPRWHYHPIDSASVAMGFLAGRGLPPETSQWSSDKLSAALGVDAGDYLRHTAMGDVLWMVAQWDNIMGTAVQS
ncbi:3'-5' exonuclease [Mycolicibacterium goodii]|uniref:3'-5' exonuclease n=1 Tax=Mycolicibacterium goodii TaxID=134601 RepID=UPI001BDD2997|nr:hypothetical protein [Mycolicibacterium goodii]MBU8834153.1 hypothetical protein [Mycolicibacterium goodii]